MMDFGNCGELCRKAARCSSVGIFAAIGRSYTSFEKTASCCSPFGQLLHSGSGRDTAPGADGRCCAAREDSVLVPAETADIQQTSSNMTLSMALSRMAVALKACTCFGCRPKQTESATSCCKELLLGQALQDGVCLEKWALRGPCRVYRQAPWKLLHSHGCCFSHAQKFTPLVEKCKTLNRAIRIGTNHGSLSARILSYYGDTPRGMVRFASFPTCSIAGRHWRKQGPVRLVLKPMPACMAGISHPVEPAAVPYGCWHMVQRPAIEEADPSCPMCLLLFPHCWILPNQWSLPCRWSRHSNLQRCAVMSTSTTSCSP